MIEKELDTTRDFVQEYEEHLAALRDGKSFEPRLTAKIGKNGGSKKRKNARDGKKGSSKKRRSEPTDDQDESMASDADYGSSNDGSSEDDSDSESVSSNDSDESPCGSDAGSDAVQESEITRVSGGGDQGNKRSHQIRPCTSRRGPEAKERSQ